jgi:uncharacterized protein
LRALLALLLALAWSAAPAAAQQLPSLTGRVVDSADLLPPEREAALTQKLESLERTTSRQLVVVTVPNLQGYSVEDFGYRLGEQWKIGAKGADNGAILLVSPAEKKIRIEVGDGLEPILTDAMSGFIIRESIRPRFQAGDYPGGIDAGVDAIIEQLRAPPEVAEQKALEAQRQQQGLSRRHESGSILPLLFWGIILFFIVIPMFRGRRGGRRYGRRGPVVLWGPGFGGGGWGGGGSSWGSGGGGWGGGGGFSGGGGSFGGGGASGGW